MGITARYIVEQGHLFISIMLGGGGGGGYYSSRVRYVVKQLCDGSSEHIFSHEKQKEKQDVY